MLVEPGRSLVANAGINGVWAPLDQLDVCEWDATLKTNLRGTFLTVKEALPLLRPHGGSVAIVSSINGTRIFSNSGATAYSCSKAAQVAFAKMVALELAKDRIRVNVVCPGAITTRIDDSTVRRDLDDLHLPVDFPEGNVPLTGGGPGDADQVAEVARSIVQATEHDNSDRAGDLITANELVVPVGTRARDVQAFLAEHAEWIESARRHVTSRYAGDRRLLPTRIRLISSRATAGIRSRAGTVIPCAWTRSATTGEACSTTRSILPTCT